MKNGQKYIEFSFIANIISSEQSALEMIMLCTENWLFTIKNTAFFKK